jgi:anti-anti-sigma regulatory factor
VAEDSTVGAMNVDILAAPPLVTVTGDIDLGAARELRTVLLGLLSMGHGAVAIDLSGVDAIDSCVPEVLAEVAARGLVAHLRNPSRAAQELLHLEAS